VQSASRNSELGLLRLVAVTLQKIAVFALLAVGVGCGVGPGDPRVGNYVGSFDGCGAVGSASLWVNENGYAYLDTALNDTIETGSEYHQLGGFSPDISFNEVRNSLDESVRYEVKATLSSDYQQVTGTFTATKSIPGRLQGDPELEPRQCQFALMRTYWDPLAVDARAAEFACTGRVELMELPYGGIPVTPDTSHTAPVPSCFGGPLQTARVRPPAIGRYAISSSMGNTVYDYEVRPIAAFSSCTGRELACSATFDGSSGVGPITVDLTRFGDVLIVSSGQYEVNFEARRQ
jgi:hypothetical protein